MEKEIIDRLIEGLESEDRHIRVLALSIFIDNWSTIPNLYNT